MKVPKWHRDWWQVQAKLKGTDVSKLVKTYLESELGLPDPDKFPITKAHQN